jgi:hypothetical protein
MRLISILIALLLPSLAWSAVYNSADCSRAAVATAVGLAEDGDTVTVPACDETAWTDGMVLTKAIVLQGGGAGTTTLKVNFSYSGTLGDPKFALFTYYPTLPDAAHRFRITGFTINNDNKAQTISIYNPAATAENIRIDHNILIAGASYRNIYVNGTVFGVIDNNTVTGYGFSFYGTGTTQWDSITRNFGDEKQLYVEDNAFSSMDGIHGSGQGGRYAHRYNSYSGTTVCIVEFHGNQPGGNDCIGDSTCGNIGTMVVEVYGNDWNLGAGGAGNVVDQRGGKALIFLNKLTNGVNSTAYAREEYADNLWPVGSYVQKPTESYWWANISSTQGLLPSSVNEDENCCLASAEAWQANHDYGTDLTCKKFTGDSGGHCWKSTPYGSPTDGISGSSEPNWDASASRYTLSDGGVRWLNMGAGTPILGTDVRMQAAGTFDGTGSTGGGVGCGTIASRPATCTAGVGYWATTQSCSDLTGLVGIGPATPISGTLYKCTVTDTWESYYTPYTYPHPLRDESGVPSASSCNGCVRTGAQLR